jgi:hypothetical protein
MAAVITAPLKDKVWWCSTQWNFLSWLTFWKLFHSTFFTFSLERARVRVAIERAAWFMTVGKNYFPSIATFSWNKNSSRQTLNAACLFASCLVFLWREKEKQQNKWKHFRRASGWWWWWGYTITFAMLNYEDQTSRERKRKFEPTETRRLLPWDINSALLCRLVRPKVALSH